MNKKLILSFLITILISGNAIFCMDKTDSISQEDLSQISDKYYETTDDEVLSDSDLIFTADNFSCDKEVSEKANPKNKNNSNNKRKISIRKSAATLYFCAYCNYSTKYKATLKSHEYTHTKEKPHKCIYKNCNFKSAHASCLNRHLRNMHKK